MKKKILVDLSSLKRLCSGLGQVALNYGRYFQEKYNEHNSKYEFTLLVPRKMIGQFGNKVNYLSSDNIIRKHFHLFFPQFDIWQSLHQLSRFSPTSKDTKQILTIHDLNYLYERKGVKRKMKHLKMQNKVDRADEIVCISEFTKTEVEHHLDLKSKRCLVVYNGVERLDLIDISGTKMDVKTPFFFAIGVIEPKKNFHVLLDLMKLMPDMHLYIAGKESSKPRNRFYAGMIRDRIEKENINNVTLLGPVPNDQKVWLYTYCEALLFPSLFEGFGLPVIEAMQFGKPVFSSKKTSLKEIGGKFAYYWDNFEPEHMKSVIDSNLAAFYPNNELVHQVKEYAYSFSYEKHFEEYEKLYEKL